MHCQIRIRRLPINVGREFSIRKTFDLTVEECDALILFIFYGKLDAFMDLVEA